MELGTPQKPIKMTRKILPEYIVAAGKVLDEQNVPKRGRILAYWDGEKTVIIGGRGGDTMKPRKITVTLEILTDIPAKKFNTKSMSELFEIFEDTYDHLQVVQASCMVVKEKE